MLAVIMFKVVAPLLLAFLKKLLVNYNATNSYILRSTWLILSVTVGSVQRFLGKCDGAKSRGRSPWP